MSSLCLLGSLFAFAVLCLVLLITRWRRHLAARIEALARVSTLDPLTGLPNGRLFEVERWPAAIRNRAPLCLLYIDLDHLKEQNDRFGRRIGDLYIVRAAAQLRQACRRGIDPIFRLHTAGDEFVVLLHGDDALHGETVARHILCFLVREHITASIGIASTLSADHRSRVALLEQAEEAMKQAKRAGKGRFVVFTPVPTAANSQSEPIPEAIHDSPVQAIRKRS